jgi:hypothetical protein
VSGAGWGSTIAGFRSGEILLDTRLKVMYCLRVDIELPLQVADGGHAGDVGGRWCPQKMSRLEREEPKKERNSYLGSCFRRSSGAKGCAPTRVAAATCHRRGRSGRVAEDAGGGCVALATVDTERTKRGGEEKGYGGMISMGVWPVFCCWGKG